MWTPIAVNRDSLPPLLALRALEVCARLESFSKAADELGVTPGAISQQIRSIEAWAGAPLFRRTGRSVELKEDTREALPILQDAFDRLAEVGQMLKSRTRSSSIVAVSAPPSFTTKWLVPRLERFRALHPDIEVWVSADMELVDFSRQEVDVAVRYGAGHYDGLVVERLLGEAVLPVASPGFIERFGPFQRPVDLMSVPLLHDQNVEADPTCPDWSMWLRARGVERAIVRGARFNQSSLVIEEAAAGAGVALAKATIAQADLRAGRLKVLFDDATPLGFAYWIVWPRGRSLTVAVRKFISWLKTETSGDVADGAGI